MLLTWVLFHPLWFLAILYLCTYRCIVSFNHICIDTRNWSRGSAKPTSTRLSLDAKDSTISLSSYI